MKAFVEQKQYEKFSRWLGFIQGTLFCCREFTIDDLRKHILDAELKE